LHNINSSPSDEATWGGLSLSRETQDMKSCEMTIGLMKCHFVFASGLLNFSEFMDIDRERPKDNAPSAK